MNKSDAKIVSRMNKCFEQAKKMFEQKIPDVVLTPDYKFKIIEQNHFTFEVTEVAVALFNAGYGK